jgi:hypothetical protein
MKKRLLSILAIPGMVVMGLMAQDPVLIIDENFQDWPATEGVVSDPPEDCESFNHIAGPDEYDITYETGGTGKVTLIKYLISPECNSKRVNRGDVVLDLQFDVTTGFVGLTKVENEGDTIGEMRLPKLSNVTQIEFGFSCTGSSRGIRLYTSTDDGATWEGPWTPDGPGTGEIIATDDAQLGEYRVIDINRDNVILKFTSGVDLDGVSQNSRLHDLKVWGVPGSQETGIADMEAPGIKAYYVRGAGLVVEGEVASAGVYDLNGRLILRSDQPGDQIIDLSGYAEGTYILRATDIHQRGYTMKFTKF